MGQSKKSEAGLYTVLITTKPLVSAKANSIFDPTPDSKFLKAYCEMLIGSSLANVTVCSGAVQRVRITKTWAQPVVEPGNGYLCQPILAMKE